MSKRTTKHNAKGGKRQVNERAQGRSTRPEKDQPKPSGPIKLLLPWLLLLVMAGAVVAFGLDLGAQKAGPARGNAQDQATAGETSRGARDQASGQRAAQTSPDGTSSIAATSVTPGSGSSALSSPSLGSGSTPQTAPTKVSSVRFDPPLIQWGFLKPGEVKVMGATVTNEGHEPIRFTGAMKGCSCTTVDVAAVELQPGETLPFSATMTAGLTPTSKSSKLSLVLEDHVPISVPTDGEIVRGIRVSPRRMAAVTRNRQDPDAPPTVAQVRRIRFDAPQGRPFRILRIDGVDVASFPLGAGLLQPKPLHTFIFDDLKQFDPETGLDAEGTPIKLFRLVETDHPDAAVIEVPVDHPMRIAQLQRRGNRPWFFVENRFVANTVAPGGTTIVDVPLLVDPRVTWEPPTAVTSLSDDFDARLVGLVPVGRKQRARIEVTPKLTADGAYIGDLKFESANFSVTVPLIGAVRLGGDAS